MTRPAFELENNINQLRDLLVPDPLKIEVFNAVAATWLKGTKEDSFAACLITRGVLSEKQWLQQLGAATGAPTIAEARWLTAGEVEPAESWVYHDGMAFVRDAKGRCFIVGGQLPVPAARLHMEKTYGHPVAVISPLLSPEMAVGPDTLPDQATGGAAIEREVKRIIETEWVRSGTDIHFESHGHSLRVRAKRNGSLQVVAAMDGDPALAAMRILKRLALLSTADNCLPQEGRMAIECAGSRVLLRVGCVSTHKGESIVLRALNGLGGTLAIERLNFDPGLICRIHKIITHGSGLLLCTGPTGAGKSTTAASLLAHLTPKSHKLVTIEDPVENEIDGAFQSNVNETAGWTYAAALKAFMRQDPDVIFIGEIRDAAVASLACHAALTGHAVVATLHATSTSAAIERLQQWRLPSGLIEESVSLVLNQRLIRDPATGELSARVDWDEPAHKSVQAR